MRVRGGPGPAALLDYVNVPRALGHVVSARLATLAELDTVYGVEDVYDMLEVLSVDAHNQRVMNKAR